MKTRRRKLISLFVLFLLACDATFSVGYPTATSAPPTGTATVTPPSLKLTLTSIPYNENNQSPPSTITALIPQLTGSDDPRVTSFNEAVNLLLAAEIESFKAGLVGLPDPPAIAVSSFDAKYTVIHQGGDLWSLQFDIAAYADGAAHEGYLIRTLNYDFAQSRIINLHELFLADSNYLEFISEFCSKELAARAIGFDETTVGAGPTLENYRNWNVTPEGLVVTFERGQVAAYAAPAQIVTIPYDELKTIVNPQGPLSVFLR